MPAKRATTLILLAFLHIGGVAPDVQIVAEPVTAAHPKIDKNQKSRSLPALGKCSGLVCYSRSYVGRGF
jgi:hypothetical protein